MDHRIIRLDKVKSLVIKWKRNQELLVSECGTICVRKGHEEYVLEDHIEGDLVEFKSEQEALKEAGERLLLTTLKDFYPFRSMLDLKHEISE